MEQTLNLNVDQSEGLPNKGKKKKRNILLRILIIILAFFLIVGGIFYAVFFNEVNALFSIKRIDDKIYYMQYNGDYYFDQFLDQGASTDEELISFLMNKLLKGLPINFEVPDFGCSTFTATTTTGDKLFARNYDMDYSPIVVTKTMPNNGYDSISTTDLSAIGFNINYLPDALFDKVIMLATPYVPFDGMNEKGVALSVNMVTGERTKQELGLTPITTTTMIRLILDKADSVATALDLIEDYQMNDSTGGPFHFHIADVTGDSAVVEYVDNELKITRIGADDSYQAMTNFFIYEDEGIDDFGRDRYNIIRAKLDSTNGVLDEDEAVELLEAAKNVSDFGVDEIGGTMWSNIFNLSKKTVTFYSFADFENKICVVSLCPFLISRIIP